MESDHKGWAKISHVVGVLGFLLGVGNLVVSYSMYQSEKESTEIARKAEDRENTKYNHELAISLGEERLSHISTDASNKSLQQEFTGEKSVFLELQNASKSNALVKVRITSWHLSITGDGDKSQPNPFALDVYDEALEFPEFLLNTGATHKLTFSIHAKPELSKAGGYRIEINGRTHGSYLFEIDDNTKIYKYKGSWILSGFTL